MWRTKMALFSYPWVYLTMCFRPVKNSDSVPQRRELNLWSFTSWLSSEFKEIVQWNCFIIEERCFLSLGKLSKVLMILEVFLHILWCTSSSSPSPRPQLATLSISAISLLSCWILNLWLCSRFQYLCCSFIVCIVGYFTMRNFVGIEN